MSLDLRIIYLIDWLFIHYLFYMLLNIALSIEFFWLASRIGSIIIIWIVLINFIVHSFQIVFDIMYDWPLLKVIAIIYIVQIVHFVIGSYIVVSNISNILRHIFFIMLETLCLLISLVLSFPLAIQLIQITSSYIVVGNNGSLFGNCVLRI